MNTLRQHFSLCLLSDPQRRPVALQLVPAVGIETQDDALELHGLTALTPHLPCLVLTDDWARLSEKQQAALALSGCQTAAALDIARLDSLTAVPRPGARYLRGDWYLQHLSKPTAQPTGSRALALKLVKLVAADADTWELEEVFRLEPTLTYNLLRLVNSAGMGSGRRIDNLAQAILFLGRRQLKRWLNLMLFAAQKDDPRSAMLLAHVAVRSRTCELLAKEAGLDRDAQESAFLTGMFSLLGVMFSLSLPELLKPLNLDAEMNTALLTQQGELGRILACVQAIEKQDTAAVQSLTENLLPAGSAIDALVVDAHLWMVQLIKSNGESGHD